jgi:hypothetical protein
VPDQIRKPTPGADLPADDAGLKGWQTFADAQTGQLDKANLKHEAGFEIIERCEARDAELDAKLAKKR